MKQARVLFQGQQQQVTQNEAGQWCMPSGQVLGTHELEFLPPAQGNILGVAVNTVRHAEECELELPQNPILYFKLANTLVGHGQPVQKPDQIDFYTPQAELVVVIGKDAHRIAPEQALEHVAGYTILNNFTAQEWVRGYYRPPVKAKNFDGSGALGPAIVPASLIANPNQLTVQTRVNGELLSQASTADYVHSVEQVIAWAASFMTLRAGDMITLGGLNPLVALQPGDQVDVSIEGIGSLSSPVVSQAEFYAKESAPACV